MSRVLLTVTLTSNSADRPATDLGHLLVKHPDRVQSFAVTGGTAHVFYPEATAERCTAALLLEIDTALLRRREHHGAPEGFTLRQHVNDRTYAASSLLSAALTKVYRSALKGNSRDRPDLAAASVPLTLRIPALRCRGGAGLAHALFTPLRWSVGAVEIPLDGAHPEWGRSPYVDLTLTGTMRLRDALTQVYVLLPVLDDAKHYWVASDEVDKLLRAGAGWLASHPERGLIVRRYLAHRRSLADDALRRLSEDGLGRLSEVDPAAEAAPEVDEDAELPPEARRAPLAARRRDAVLAALDGSGATRVLDLGCGPGALLGALVANRRYTEIVGVDVSAHALSMAERRLRLDRLPERQRGRIRLMQSALTYRDDRLKGFDAAVLMEVIEHVDPPRLPALAAAVFGHAAPTTVVVTTPNVEYNSHYEGLAEGRLRHHDHRFEWDRATFAAWAASVAGSHGYTVSISGVGDEDASLGTATQMAVFSK
jgi:3' terminal RNA ribose 2'-O-methyltransferase Hen1